MPGYNSILCNKYIFEFIYEILLNINSAEHEYFIFMYAL